jgi:hypothetical protein
MSFPGAPVFAWPMLEAEFARLRGENGAAVETRQGDAPSSSQGSKRAVEAFRWACRVLDAGEGA